MSAKMSVAKMKTGCHGILSGSVRKPLRANKEALLPVVLYGNKGPYTEKIPCCITNALSIPTGFFTIAQKNIFFEYSPYMPIHLGLNSGEYPAKR